MDLGLLGVHVLITGLCSAIGDRTHAVTTFLNAINAGASGGIGLETAEIFHEQGAIVTAHYNSNYTPLENFVDSRSQAVQADLTNEDEVEEMFKKATYTYGPVQILIINHAISVVDDADVWEMSFDRWKHTIETNLNSTFLVAREYLKQLKAMARDLKEEACIILIGSTAGKYGEAGHADYAASKSAMMYGLTMSLKNEIVKLAPKGRVNCIAPGWVRTAMATESLRDPNVLYAALATTPLKRIAEPVDIANQIVVLSSNKISGHVTGQVLMVEGGMEGRVLNKPEDVGISF